MITSSTSGCEVVKFNEEREIKESPKGVFQLSERDEKSHWCDQEEEMLCDRDGDILTHFRLCGGCIAECEVGFINSVLVIERACQLVASRFNFNSVIIRVFLWGYIQKEYVVLLRKATYESDLSLRCS